MKMEMENNSMSIKDMITEVYESDLGDLVVKVDREKGKVSFETKTIRVDETGEFSIQGRMEIDGSEFINIIKSMEGILINKMTREQISLNRICDQIGAVLRENKTVIEMISNGDLRDIVVFESDDHEITVESASALFNVLQSLASYYLVNNV
jgi:predicted regulator of Ras-like GTPase activity (Roadblock/LC7/MglB family)